MNVLLRFVDTVIYLLAVSQTFHVVFDVKHNVLVVHDGLQIDCFPSQSAVCQIDVIARAKVFAQNF